MKLQDSNCPLTETDGMEPVTTILLVWSICSGLLLSLLALAMEVQMGERFFYILNYVNVPMFVLAVLFCTRLNRAIHWLMAKYSFMSTTAKFSNATLVPQGDWIGWIFLLTAGLASLYPMWLAVGNSAAYFRLIQEDGFVENASATFWFFAAVSLSIAIIRQGKTPANLFQKTFCVLIVLFFVLAGGEEISWGQRLFDLETPELLKRVNVQNELTIHNTGSTSIFSNFFFLLAVAFFLVLPWLARKHESVRQIAAYYVLPVPNRFAVGTFLITLSVWLFVGIRFGTLGFHPFSFFEEKYYNQFDDEIFECFTAFSFFCFSVMENPKQRCFPRKPTKR